MANGEERGRSRLSEELFLLLDTIRGGVDKVDGRVTKVDEKLERELRELRALIHALSVQSEAGSREVAGRLGDLERRLSELTDGYTALRLEFDERLDKLEGKVAEQSARWKVLDAAYALASAVGGGSLVLGLQRLLSWLNQGSE